MHTFITRAEQAAGIIERQIQFTRIYQDIGVHAPTWQNVEGLIKKAKKGLLPESILLTQNLGNLEMYADPLQEKIFYTLMENSLRHGMPVSEIRFLYHVTGDQTLHLIYEDNGVVSITGLVITETGEPGKGARFEIAIPKEAYRFAL